MLRTTAIWILALVVGLPLTVRPAAAGSDPDRAGTRGDSAVDRVKKKVTGEEPAREENPVKRAQRALNARGYDAGEVDGKLSDKTRQAVRAFQKDEGLKVTGRLDAETLARLQSKGDIRPSVSDRK